jgi:radical SAM superfamily enzyme YgiQ (UPF0313 family)
MKALLISTYDLGRQPFGLASPAAWLREAGWEVTCADTSREPLDVSRLSDAALIGFHLPMHTAARLAGPLIERARHANADARICAYGVYAPLNERWLRTLGVDAVFGGEFEKALTQWASQDASERSPARPISAGDRPPRLRFLVPDRSTLPHLSKYATLQLADGASRLVGYTEASRGCRHFCRHCPIVPVYGGHFRVVQADVVLADIDAQVAAGAGHITFGDPDFFNGPTHALRIVEALHQRHPSLTYDVTIKIEHLIRNRHLLPRLVATGCAFVTSAVESVDDRVLALLDKGHTRADFEHAVKLTRDAGLTLAPTFVAFHPWLSLAAYCDLLQSIDRLGLVDHVAPIQFAIRLLIPEGSRLLELSEMRQHVGAFDSATLTYRWVHRDPRVDALHDEVSAIVERKLTVDRRETFNAICEVAFNRAGLRRPASKPARDRATVPYLNEPWYC